VTMDAASLSKQTVVVLKQKLRDHKLPVSGRKAELVRRLADFYAEQNKSCAGSEVVVPQTLKAKPKVSNNVATLPKPVEVTWGSKETVCFDESYSLYVEPEKNSLHFVLPVVGETDNEKSLLELYQSGFIPEQEYQTRLQLLRNKPNFYASTLCSDLQNMSIDGDQDLITAKDYKVWRLTIKEENNQMIVQMIERMSKILRSNANLNSIQYEEQVERICTMLRKLRLPQFELTQVHSLFSIVSSVLALSKQETILLQILQTLSTLGSLNCRQMNVKLLTSNIEQLLLLVEEQIRAGANFSMEVTKHVAAALQRLIKSYNLKILSGVQKGRLISILLTLCKDYKQPNLLGSSLLCLSSVCYDAPTLDVVSKHPYFLELLHVHLSSSNWEVLNGAVAVCINLASGTDEIMDSIIQIGILDRIVALLRQHFLSDSQEAKNFVKECYFCLSNFAGGNTKQVELFLDRDVIDLLVSQYSSATSEIKREMLWCLSNIMLSGARPEYYEDERIFLVALEMLQDPNMSDSDGEQLRKGLHSAKNILPQLGFDHPSIATLLELLS